MENGNEKRKMHIKNENEDENANGNEHGKQNMTWNMINENWKNEKKWKKWEN